MDKETEKALKDYIGLVKLVIKTDPNCPVGHIFDCACLGPLPECRCMKQERLISEFMNKATEE